MKTLKTILLVTAIVSSIVLWFTREEYLPSLSAFALSSNAMFYRLMHLSASWFFLINAVEFKKYATEFAIAIGMGLILTFDMYNSPILHDIFTASTLLLACSTLLINVKKERLNIVLAISICILSVGVFGMGYFTTFHLLLAEIIAMSLISTGKLIEIYNE